jgi:hypothetical protein
MYDEAYKKQPGNEELGAQTFIANAKISNWKVAQQVNLSYPICKLYRHQYCYGMLEVLVAYRSFVQVSTRMHKTFKDDRYLYWSIMAAVLQVSNELMFSLDKFHNIRRPMILTLLRQPDLCFSACPYVSLKRRLRPQ